MNTLKQRAKFFPAAQPAKKPISRHRFDKSAVTACTLLIMSFWFTPQAMGESPEPIIARPSLTTVKLCTANQNSGTSGDRDLYYDSHPPCAPAKNPYFFIDEFERKNAESLGPDWIDCKRLAPESFEPLGIYHGAVVVADPHTRTGVYDSTPPSGSPPTDNRLYPGIGCAFVDTGSTTVSIKMIWSGNYGIEQDPPVFHVEATPLLYITPSNPRFGFGTWISQLYGVPAIFAGYIGNPPEKFEVIAYALLDEHQHGTSLEVELRAEDAGKVTLWADGVQLSFEPGGLNPLDVDVSMIESTLHGIAVDAHFVDPPTNIPIIDAIKAVTIRQIN
jgi:hypothetical protein